VVAHADWGVEAKKRWVAVAILQPDGHYAADIPRPVGVAGTLLDRMGSPRLSSGPALLGFDFPIGLPRAYAAKTGISFFPEVLGQFGAGEWSRFWEVADAPETISLHRPFYPSRPGGRKLSHLTDALGLDRAQLFRRCELKTFDRRAACPLFWTLGGNQVGKGALSGWRILQPVLQAADTAIWPFHGRLSSCLQSASIVVAETYPAEFYGHLGVRFDHLTGGKRTGGGRAAQSEALLRWASQHDVELTAAHREAIASGFGIRSDGEDRFDALIGLFGMLNVVLGNRPPGDPHNDAATSVEGWILGQTADP
jgi:hypothetical protein